ncbi:PREDICTED: geranylgeranyl transferase type-1 subunit beta-like isoform X2 [Amphimedon queenslandica]|nr:PREDICTED: geranylgeranyl transferase type-1 subunit beta-like isoform X2 [Amphimedon queenslandica]|eukprot:XP_019855708.1 PREDICTED: geranylgeranyl transferase type-1 subunit beta-like isoform X2 [Amphimedon queenslandica]
MSEVDAVKEEEEFVVKKHVRYFSRCLDILPTQCQSLDANRMTILFFCLSGLDVLDNLSVIDDQRGSEIIEWIYSQQVLPDQSDESSLSKCGFRGSSFLGVPHDNSKSPVSYPYDCSHIAMTYTALSCLLILGDNLSRINKPAVLTGIKALQQPDGSFCSTVEQSESDMRFVYCACCVSYILNDWSVVDVSLTADYIKKSLAYNFGFGQGPSLESHGGSTYCAVASLVLMNKLESTLTLREIERIKKWCIMRQLTGFQGRPNKPADTCYSFWIGATLEMLGASDWVDKELNVQFILSTEGEYTGGFSKWPKCHPDPLHSYLGLCGLSLTNYSQLKPISAPLNISQRAAEWLQSIRGNF